MFSSLSKESIDKERKRHDKTIEDLQRAQLEWAKKRQERLDYINNEIIKEHKAEKKVYRSKFSCATVFPSDW